MFRQALKTAAPRVGAISARTAVRTLQPSPRPFYQASTDLDTLNGHLPASTRSIELQGCWQVVVESCLLSFNSSPWAFRPILSANVTSSTGTKSLPSSRQRCLQPNPKLRIGRQGNAYRSLVDPRAEN